MKETDKKMIEDLLQQLKKAEEKNRYYEQLLKENGISYASQLESETTVKTEVPEQPVNLTVALTHEHVSLFQSVFRGRSEFYARRTKYQTYTRPCWNRYDRSGICPKQTKPEFPCRQCKCQNFIRLNGETVLRHLKGEKEDGSDVIGIYPITADNTCWFLVYDFDDHNHRHIFENAAHKDEVTGKDLFFWNEVSALRQILRKFQVPYLIERSRSGYGAHVWIFFEREIPCVDARRFGNYLLSEGMNLVRCTSFRTYDRMLPMQDRLEENQAGNLIALPLQGRALTIGNSAFVNDSFVPYPDQWQVLRELKRMPVDAVYRYLEQWKNDNPYGESVFVSDEDPTLPWEKDQTSLIPDDVQGKMQIVLANGVYVDKTNMNVRMQNRIRRLALYRNPEYFQTKKRYSEINTMKIPYYIYCGRDIRNYIFLPRGCAESLYSALEKASVVYELQDKTEHSRSVKATFTGQLKENQKQAAETLKNQKNGIVSAATAFGKTVLGAALIGERKINTLILVNRSEIMDGWFETLQEFLDIQEELPEYTTPKGKVKKRKTIIGRYGSGRHELNGIIDIAMIQSLVTDGTVKNELVPLIKDYGMVLVDECHHVSGNEYQVLLNTVMAESVYGFTATPKRYDSQDQKMYFQLGRIRYRFSAKDRAAEQNIDHLIYPRFTSTVNTGTETNDYTKLLDLLTKDTVRNHFICDDVIACLRQKRTVMILTKRVEHANILYDMLKDRADHVFNMAGKMTVAAHKTMNEERKNVSDGESVILISTGSKAGEGFNYPCLDTLMLAAPVSWEGSIEQYAGRLNRDYPGKKNVIVFDYVDSAIPVFERMYRKRLHTYRQIGFEVCAAMEEGTVEKGSIYTGITYMQEFIRDIQTAKKDALIVSPYLSSSAVRKISAETEETVHRGITVHVITIHPEALDEEYQQAQQKKIQALKIAGIFVTAVKSRKMDFSYAVIDQKIIWYGSVNMLAANDEDSEIIRLNDPKAGLELIQKALQYTGRKKPEHSLQTRMDI